MSLLADYYAILQVAPEAEQEVIDAAYRQLMRKYHPDLAGGDPLRASELHERATAINQAYSVLRDPRQRETYDRLRMERGTRQPPPPPRPRPRPTPTDPVAATAPAAAAAATAPPEPAVEPDDDLVPVRESLLWNVLAMPFHALGALYYLLPGPYEWDRGAPRAALFTALVPPCGVLAWLVWSGRLEPLVGESMLVRGLILVVLGLILFVVRASSVPRMVLVGGGALALASGVANASLANAGVPIWLAWGLILAVALLVAARDFFFGVLPTVGVCWLIAR